ncbi:hypothetical protein BKA62DRAFT_287755 [Auriculariales sp. MPI-PUGE-AT-0066]|nr:hypothetical protein BKA62DRAFT_287755 [Auriculariales sp. MPI-PUGE-AT-0066]
MCTEEIEGTDTSKWHMVHTLSQTPKQDSAGTSIAPHSVEASVLSRLADKPPAEEGNHAPLLPRLGALPCVHHPAIHWRPVLDTDCLIVYIHRVLYRSQNKRVQPAARLPAAHPRRVCMSHTSSSSTCTTTSRLATSSLATAITTIIAAPACTSGSSSSPAQTCFHAIFHCHCTLCAPPILPLRLRESSYHRERLCRRVGSRRSARHHGGRSQASSCGSFEALP